MKYSKLWLGIGLLSLLLWSCGEDYTEDFPVPPASLVAQFEVVNEKPYVTGDSIYFENKSVIPEHFGEASFNWNFGDGTTASAQNPVHVFPEEGEYEVKLTLVTTSDDTASQTASLALKNLLIGDTIFQENFNNLSLIPEEYELVNVDGNEPNSSFTETFADSAWAVRYSSVFGNNVATAISWYEPEAEADDWMILPQLSIGDSAALRWDALSFTSSGEYPDSYEIYISTGAQTVEDCKANGSLLRVVDESWRTTADIPGDGIKSRRLYLSEHGFKNQDVYVAFRLMTPSPGGSSLGIDNIAVVEIE